ncbi:MAG: hypothetical protein U1F16_05165 [Turneriella sp.]
MYFLSDEVCRLTGYEAGDFIGNRVRTFASIIHPDGFITRRCVRAGER